MRRLQSVLLAAVAVVGFVSIASAADMPVKAPVAAPVPYTWTGCYVGANLGYGRAHSALTDLESVPIASAGTYDGSGIVGGGQIGCDYQSGPWVFGIQGLLDGANLKGRGLNPENPSLVAFNSQTSWFGTLTGRIGYAFEPATLAYVKGGGAWAHYKENQEFPLGTIFDSGSITVSGWTVGGGLEHIFAPNWSVFVEYNYMKLGHGDPLPLVPGNEYDRNIQTALVGINYRFSVR